LVVVEFVEYLGERCLPGRARSIDDLLGGSGQDLEALFLSVTRQEVKNP